MITRERKMAMTDTSSPSAGIRIRGFRAGDGPLLAESWSKAAPGDPIGYRRFRDLVLLDRNFDPAGLQVAEVDGVPAGAAYAVRRLIPESGADLQPETGWIGFFFVDPRVQRRGVGRTLITAALDWLRGQGCRTVFFSPTTPNYFLPGLDADRYPAADALLRDLGFETHYQAVAMDRTLNDYAMPGEIRDQLDRLAADGYRFGSPTSDELPGLITIAGDAFNADWARAIREGVVGGLPLDRIVAVFDPAGEPLGWAMHGTYEQVPERFGPFGVLPTKRGLGLGKMLLHLTLERMRAAGCHSAWFLWTDTKSAAGQLYLKTGFTVTRTFTIMKTGI